MKRKKKLVIFVVMAALFAGGTISAFALSKYKSNIISLLPGESVDLPDTKDKQPGFKEFSFEIKDSYANDEEIDAEIDKLRTAYKENTEGCSDINMQQSKQKNLINIY